MTDILGNGSDFDNGYRLLMWSVDVLDGDNPQSDSITEHGMVDADARKFELAPPAIWADKQAEMGNKELNDKYDLVGLPERLLAMLSGLPESQRMRKQVLAREIQCAELRVMYSLSDVTGEPKPTFTELWEGVTGQKPPTLATLKTEIAMLHDHIRTLLGQLGVNTSGKSMREAVAEWEHRQLHFGVRTERTIKDFIVDEVKAVVGLFKAAIVKVPELTPYAGRLTTQNYHLNVLPDMAFDAGLSYIGGVGADGQPTGAANFEWNAGRPATMTDIQYIAGHETAHMLNAQLMDLRRRDGLLGPEAALLTMSSPRCMNEEGLAQVFWELLYGSFQGVMDARGVGFGINILLDQLQDIARLTAAVGWNLDFADVKDEEVRRKLIHGYIVDGLLQTEHIAHKYMGPKKMFWRQTPGGNMYAPAYYYGSRAYRQALEQYGAQKVLQVGCHGKGLVDLQAFEELVAQ